MTTGIVSKNILIVGGAFGGLSALKSIINNITKNQTAYSSALSNKNILKLNLDITVLEPRNGFINILGIPLALLDLKHANESYFEYNQKTLNLPINNTLNISDSIIIKINHIKDRCHRLYSDHAITSSNQVLNFDYCSVSTGRTRNWPLDPKGLTRLQFVDEMGQSLKKIKSANSVVVIGGGALGVEVAGEIKQHYPDKSVKLIHPHANILKEPKLPKEFAEKSTEILQNVIGKENTLLNTRVLDEIKKGNNKNDGLITLITNNPEHKEIKADLVYWCNSHKNNIDYLKFENSPFLGSLNQFDQVRINNDCSIKGFEDKIFAAGDITDLDFVKSAGGAMHCGGISGDNISNVIFSEFNAQNLPKSFITLPGAHMSVTFGNKSVITCTGEGEILFNAPRALMKYTDYCNKLVSKKLDLGLDSRL
ncbi:uncharacterized protein ASCRUDRAFT_73946 [Ascoidea rubescens DSM 1968]|uniref:FAD/NAD(P)-binding domain-containing protein n=1 Tax=Ascoidea rubescens DSM 1968 TaxID=1344418 RepID=A0A1D2VRR4_9ASCO|nr:hypothetical protein ASCRUDRAFT_73946 [Ascoidea rubescens DSM 1968]ODV64290.1 hypothetical protein ASCRUDRAFT_73946 [Ascoidea rubescens DSM 1968]